MRFPARAAGATPYPTGPADLDRAALLCLDRNEVTTTPAPDAAAAVAAYARDPGLHRYPDTAALTADVAAYAGVGADRVLVTNGSDQAIDITLRALLDPGDRVLLASPGFAVFDQVVGLAGGVVDAVPYEDGDLAFPYAAFRAAAATRAARVIVLVDPNNPTGTPVDAAFVGELLAAYPDVPVIVDEAYHEYTRRTVVPLLADHPNLVVFRTFSKAFGLAGLRLGYLVARPEVVAVLRAVRGPYDVNALAVVAGRAQLGAITAVRTAARELMTSVKPVLVDGLRAAGATVWPGAANFVLVRPPAGVDVVAGLFAAGILVRPLGGRLAGTVRMGIGTAAETDRVVAAYARLAPRGR